MLVHIEYRNFSQDTPITLGQDHVRIFYFRIGWWLPMLNASYSVVTLTSGIDLVRSLRTEPTQAGPAISGGLVRSRAIPRTVWTAFRTEIE